MVVLVVFPLQSIVKENNKHCLLLLDYFSMWSSDSADLWPRGNGTIYFYGSCIKFINLLRKTWRYLCWVLLSKDMLSFHLFRCSFVPSRDVSKFSSDRFLYISSYVCISGNYKWSVFFHHIIWLTVHILESLWFGKVEGYKSKNSHTVCRFSDRLGSFFSCVQLFYFK